jgi:hypothetical protein
MNSHAPTASERSALKRIASLRTGMVVALLASLCVLALSRLYPGEVAGLILNGAAVLTLLGLLVYTSFCLRCPRCSSWIPVPTSRSKCTSCGLSLEVAATDDPSAAQRS